MPKGRRSSKSGGGRGSPTSGRGGGGTGPSVGRGGRAGRRDYADNQVPEVVLEIAAIGTSLGFQCSIHTPDCSEPISLPSPGSHRQKPPVPSPPNQGGGREDPSRMDPPPSGNGGGGVDKYDFYYWLGCMILALDDSRELEFLLAVQVGDVRRLKELVNGMKKKDRAKLAEMHFDGRGLLHLAVFLGKIDAVRYFVEELGFDVDSAAPCGAPLGCAALFGEVAVARYLLDHGANPNKTDNDGSVVLLKAVKNGNEELIRLLISRGARVDVPIGHVRPLHIAALYGRTGAVKILLEHNANPNSISVVHGTPLVTALHSTEHGVRESDALECVKLLVKAGADVNSGNPSSPLAVATRNGLTDCMNYLLDAGANSNIPLNPVNPCGKYSNVQQKLHTENTFKKQDDSASRPHPEDKPINNDGKAQLKKQGEKAVETKDYTIALKFYNEAINLDPADAVLYSNKSFCHLKIGQAQDALVDANSCIRLQPEWTKGYYRKGAALMSLKEYKQACDAFMAGVKRDPKNEEMMQAFWEAAEAMKEHSAAESLD